MLLNYAEEHNTCAFISVPTFIFISLDKAVNEQKDNKKHVKSLQTKWDEL